MGAVKRKRPGGCGNTPGAGPRRHPLDKSDPRRRLADDARRTTGLMASVIADADRAGADVPDGVAASVTVWRTWAARLADWAAGGDGR